MIQLVDILIFVPIRVHFILTSAARAGKLKKKNVICEYMIFLLANIQGAITYVIFFQHLLHMLYLSNKYQMCIKVYLIQTNSPANSIHFKSFAVGNKA